MLRVDLHQAKPGMRLSLPVMNPTVPDRILLRVGFELTEQIIDKLQQVGIRSVWVRYPSLDFLGDYIDLESIRVQQQVVGEIAKTFEAMQTQAAAKMRFDTYTKSVGGLIEHLITHPGAAVFLGDIADAEDDLMRHSASVMYLALLMGIKLESYVVKERKHVDPARAKDLVNLGVGAMLHDIGVLLLPEEVRHRFEKTGDEQDPDWREHTALGFRRVRGEVEPTAATVVLNHHQRTDGSGYAGKGFPVLSDRAMHVYARIVAVADYLDTLRRPPNLPEQPTVWALSAILSENQRHRFDPVVLRAMVEVVPAYPPGTIVRLSDGRFAVAIDHEPDEPCRPPVQVIPDPSHLDPDNLPPGDRIDLALEPPTLYVAEFDGHDVGELNFGPSLINPLMAAA